MAEKRFTAGIGAANMDLHGRSRAALILHDSNPGFLHTSPGGVTRNILENLSRMGERTALFSAIGNDLYGREILASGEAVGMDMSHMRRCPDCVSSSYMALIDPEGDMFIGMSDMRILEHITPDWLEGQKDALRMCFSSAVRTASSSAWGSVAATGPTAAAQNFMPRSVP